ncbi:MAG: type II toxin-antitoxin system VapC family toxin [Spirochaetota bacterium]
MILLDTNYLIRALVADTDEGTRVSAWTDSGEELCTASIAWYEFLCGPVDEEGVDIMRAAMADRVLPFTAAVAQESARLFNAAGRRRHLRVDAMIAATAITAGAGLATGNRDDFSAFVPEGLRLV